INTIKDTILGKNHEGSSLADVVEALHKATPDELKSWSDAIAAAIAAGKAGISATPPPGTDEATAEAARIAQPTGTDSRTGAYSIDDTRPGRRKAARHTIYGILHDHIEKYKEAVRSDKNKT